MILLPAWCRGLTHARLAHLDLDQLSRCKQALRTTTSQLEALQAAYQDQETKHANAMRQSDEVVWSSQLCQRAGG